MPVLLKLLPPVWPTKANTSKDWWEEHGDKIKIEDYLAQAELDMAFRRDPSKTGSARTIANLEELSVASDNHKLARDGCLLLRDDNPRPMLLRLYDLKAKRLKPYMGLEQYARYIRFWIRSVAVALDYLNRRTQPVTSDHRHLKDALLWFGGATWHWLAGCALDGQPYPAGLRREFPSHLDAILLAICVGEKIDLSDNDLGNRPGSFMNGGPPVAAGELMLLHCRDQGLLRGLERRQPLESWFTRTERSHDGVITYFPTLVGRPGGGPILVADEMRRGWRRPRLYVLADKHTKIPADIGGDVYINQAPSFGRWQFDPEKWEAVEV